MLPGANGLKSARMDSIHSPEVSSGRQFAGSGDGYYTEKPGESPASSQPPRARTTDTVARCKASNRPFRCAGNVAWDGIAGKHLTNNSAWERQGVRGGWRQFQAIRQTLFGYVASCVRRSRQSRGDKDDQCQSAGEAGPWLPEMLPLRTGPLTAPGRPLRPHQSRAPQRWA
jgi:hypothetical protein